MSEDRLEFAWHAEKRKLEAAGLPLTEAIQYLVDHKYPRYTDEPPAQDPDMDAAIAKLCKEHPCKDAACPHCAPGEKS